MSEVEYRVLTPPSAEPVSVANFKNFARIDFSDTNNDTIVIPGLISAARQFVEQQQNRALATQTIEAILTIEPQVQGKLFGPIGDEPNWYHYEQALGANPFGVSQFYFDLPMPPVQSISSIALQYTVFDLDPNTGVPGYWTPFTGTWVLDAVREQGRVYFATPPTAYRWKFVYQAGYDPVNSYPIPFDTLQLIQEIAAFWYDNREGDALPDGIMKKLGTRRQVNV